MRDHRDQTLLLLFFLCAAVLLTLWSWTGSPLNHDEVTYLVMARSMVENGNWLDLQFYGATVHQRPPLAIWLLAASGAVTDFSLMGTRLPAMLMALLTLIFLALAVQELTPKDRQRTGMVAAALLLATPLFYFNARRPMTDTTFLAGAVAFVWCYLRAGRTPRWWLWAGIPAGWMLMSKGVVSALPLLAIATHLLLTSRRREFTKRWLWLGLGVALLLATPWHLVQTIRHGGSFWQEYIGFNVLQRAGQALFQKTPFTFYLQDLWESSPPLALLFGSGLAYTSLQLWQHRPSAPARETAIWSSHLFVALWLLTAALPLSLASTRIEHYFLPALPALAAAAALGLAPLWTRHGYLFHSTLAVLTLLFFSGNAFHLTSPDYTPDQTRFARQIKSGPAPEARVVSINHYELAIFYFLDRSVDMRTTDPRFFEIVDSAPILHRIKGVTLEPPDQLAAKLRQGPFYALTNSASLPLLCGPTGQQCGPAGPLSVTPGNHLFLVTNITQPPHE